MQVATPEERARELEEKLQKSEENDEEILKAQLNATPITQGGRILTDEEILALPTLRNPADVLVDPRWFQLWESNRKERDSWIETETAEFVHKSEVPEHVKPVMLRPLHHAKPAAKGGIDKYKSRYPIDGSMMGVDVHFDGSTFAPTPSATEVKVFFACAAHGMMEHGEVPYLMDISTAFLSTDVCPVHGAVYAWIPGAWYLADLSLQEVMNERERLLQMKVNDPEEFKRERKRWERAYPDYLLKCKSRVYGDPSASRAFYDKSLNHILAAGFQRNQAAPCTYTLAKPIGWFAENTEDGELKNEILRAATAQEGETEMELMVVQQQVLHQPTPATPVASRFRPLALAARSPLTQQQHSLPQAVTPMQPQLLVPAEQVPRSHSPPQATTAISKSTATSIANGGSATVGSCSHRLQDEQKLLAPAGEFESQAGPGGVAGRNGPRMGGQFA